MLTTSEKQYLQRSVIDLGRDLMQQAQDAHGFFTTKTRFAVSYSDTAQRQKVQEKLDHAVALLAVANIMAIFEKHLPKKYWTKVFQDPATTKKLRAYRHVRLCAVNGFTGERAIENTKDFDKQMASDEKLLGITSFSSSELMLDETAANHAFQFIRGLYDRAVIKVHSP